MPKSLIENSKSIVNLPLINIKTKQLIGSLKGKLLLVWNIYFFLTLKVLLVDLTLIKSLSEVDCSHTEFAYAYNYQGIYSTCGHRGIGVTFDADTLEKVEYVE